MGLDLKISLYLSKLSRFPLVQIAASILNRLGQGDALAFIGIFLVLAGILFKKTKWVKSGGVGILVIAFSGIFVQALKHLIGRARPGMHLGDLYFIGPNLLPNGYDSFPSGHTISSFTAAAFFSSLYPELKFPLYIVAASIALIGRVVMGHHFLTDVLAGTVLGILIGLWSGKKFKNWIERSDSPAPVVKSPEVKWNVPKLKDLLIVGAFSGIILFTGLSASALWDRDETEYAQAVLEMQQKGEWLIPTLKGQPFVEKPILLYWLVRVSYLVFGVNEFSARLPSAIFGVLTCLATYLLGTTLFGAQAGLLAGCILPTSFLFVGGFRMLLTDPFFVFFTVLSFWFYAKSLERDEPKVVNLAAAYFAIGWAVLAKGPIGFFPVPVFIFFEWMTQKPTGSRRWLKNGFKHLCLVAVSMLVALPWFWYSFSVQKDATSTFFLYNNLFRFLQGTEGHTGPMFYYVLVLALGFYPWSFFLIPFFKKEWEQDRSNETLLLLHWFLFLFLFFSICANKLPHYLLPALPPLACLLGKSWKDQIESEGAGDVSSFEGPMIATIFTSVLLVLTPLSLYAFRPTYASGRLVFPFGLFLVFACVAFRFIKTSEWQKSFATLCLGSLVLFWSFSIGALPWIENFRVMKPIALALKKNLSSDSKIYGYFVSEPSLIFYGGRLFPHVENGTIQDLLNQPGQVFVITKESILNRETIQVPYRVVEQREGFAENEGETTLVLLTNSGVPIQTTP